MSTGPPPPPPPQAHVNPTHAVVATEANAAAGTPGNVAATSAFPTPVAFASAAPFQGYQHGPLVVSPPGDSRIQLPGFHCQQQAAPVFKYQQQAAPVFNYQQQAAPVFNHQQQATPIFQYTQQAPDKRFKLLYHWTQDCATPLKRGPKKREATGGVREHYKGPVTRSSSSQGFADVGVPEYKDFEVEIPADSKAACSRCGCNGSMFLMKPCYDYGLCGDCLNTHKNYLRKLNLPETCIFCKQLVESYFKYYRAVYDEDS